MISFAPVRLAAIGSGVCKNLSVGGICFEVVGCEIDLGDVLRVTFNVGDQTIVAVGQVVWAPTLDPFTTEVGLEFIEIDSVRARLLDDYADARATRPARKPRFESRGCGLAGRSDADASLGAPWPTSTRPGSITTLHRLGPTDLERLEDELCRVSRPRRPIALVLPCLIRELRDVALKGIIETLTRVRYLRQVVVSVVRHRPARGLRRDAGGLRGRAHTSGRGATLIWNDGPRIQAL